MASRQFLYLGFERLDKVFKVGSGVFLGLMLKSHELLDLFPTVKIDHLQGVSSIVPIQEHIAHEALRLDYFLVE